MFDKEGEVLVVELEWARVLLFELDLGALAAFGACFCLGGHQQYHHYGC